MSELMDTQNLKQYESKVSYKELIQALLETKNMQPKTIGHYWESSISCRNCPFVKDCETITSSLTVLGKSPCCSDVISILLGEQTIESFLAGKLISETKYIIN